MNDILECPVCLRPFEKHTGGMYLQGPHLCSGKCTRIYAEIAGRGDDTLTAAACAILRRGRYPDTVILAAKEAG